MVGEEAMKWKRKSKVDYRGPDGRNQPLEDVLPLSRRVKHSSTVSILSPVSIESKKEAQLD